MYAETFPSVWRTARRLGVVESAVDDVVQEVFVTVYRRLDQFEGRCALKTWVFGILMRVVNNYRRTRRRKGAGHATSSVVGDPDVVVDLCAAVSCPTGMHCVAGQCIPNVRVTCGGIAGLKCPGAGECVDDPADACSPEAGGADCGGVCTCAAEGVCKRGQQWNGSPGVCACESNKGAEACGDAKCGPNQYCCNASCSLCVAEGDGCLDIAPRARPG